MEGLDALLERRFRFSVCFRTAIGLAGEGEALSGNRIDLARKWKGFAGSAWIMKGKFKSEVKESRLCVILLLGSNTKFEAIIYASTQFGSLIGSQITLTLDIWIMKL